MGFAPDFITGKRPGSLDAHIKIALELGHEISDDYEQDPGAGHDGRRDRKCTGTKGFGYYDPVYDQHKNLHQDTEHVIETAELFIITPAWIDLRKNIEHDSEQKPHAGGDKNRVPAATGDRSVHVPVGRDLFRQ